MGRRLILLLCAVATMVVMSAGVALAVVIIGTNAAENCATPIPGEPAPTEQADDITLAGGSDTCNGLGGADEIYGDSGSDDINGGNGADALYGGGGPNNTVNGGGSGGDWVSVVDGDTDDTAEGGPAGGDTCAVDNPTEAAVPPDPQACETVLYARVP
jgi:Ca2+-binding RTX toxin-like protein